MSELSVALTQAAAQAMRATANEEAAFGEYATWEQLGPSAVAAVLETLAAHYHDRAAKRAEAGGDSPQCDGDCGNDDCHMTSAVAAWQMAAAVATRTVAEVRGEDT